MELKEEFRKKISDVKEDYERDIVGLRAEYSRDIIDVSQRMNRDQSQVDVLLQRVEDLSEKMYDFEVNKKNNLIFYGITQEPEETPSMLMNKVGFL